MRNRSVISFGIISVIQQFIFRCKFHRFKKDGWQGKFAGKYWRYKCKKCGALLVAYPPRLYQKIWMKKHILKLNSGVSE